MEQLTSDDLYSLEQYASIRSVFRDKVIAHQKQRRVQLGRHLVVCFESKLTVQYQVQEILRAARIFESERIKAELAAYKPLLPNGGNLKATMMLQGDNNENLANIGECIWLQCNGAPRVYASSDYKVTGLTAMQWLVFDLDSASRASFKQQRVVESTSVEPGNRSKISIGVEHERYKYQRALPRSVCDSIAEDLPGIRA